MFLPNIYVRPSLSFPPRSPQSPQDAFQDITQHFVTTFSQLILVVTVSENFIDFDVTSTVWRRAGQVSQWTPFHLHFSVFLTAEPGLWILLLPPFLISLCLDGTMPMAAQPWQAAPSWLPLFIKVYKAKLQTLTSINTHFLQIVSSESQEDCWGPVFVSPPDSCLNEGGDHTWFLCSSIPVLGTKSVPSSCVITRHRPSAPHVPQPCAVWHWPPPSDSLS